MHVNPVFFISKVLVNESDTKLLQTLPNNNEKKRVCDKLLKVIDNQLFKMEADVFFLV
jgi:hypothetical protein